MREGGGGLGGRGEGGGREGGRGRVSSKLFEHDQRMAAMNSSNPDLRPASLLADKKEGERPGGRVYRPQARCRVGDQSSATVPLYVYLVWICTSVLGMHLHVLYVHIYGFIHTSGDMHEHTHTHSEPNLPFRL